MSDELDRWNKTLLRQKLEEEEQQEYRAARMTAARIIGTRILFMFLILYLFLLKNVYFLSH